MVRYQPPCLMLHLKPPARAHIYFVTESSVNLGGVPGLAEMQALRPRPPRSDRRERSRVRIQRPQNRRFRCSNETLRVSSTPSSVVSVCPNRCTTLTVEGGSTMLATRPTLFKRDTKRAPAVVAECRIGRSGTLRTTCRGKPSVESGAAVPSGASPDTEPVSPALPRSGCLAPRLLRAG